MVVILTTTSAGSVALPVISITPVVNRAVGQLPQEVP